MICVAASYIPPMNIRVKTIRNQRVVHHNISDCKKYPNILKYAATPLEQAIKNAQEICTGDDKHSCAVAWDVVEELSVAAADKKQEKKYKVDDIPNDLEPTIDDSVIFDL
jgi:hypothetical protein